MKRLILSLSMVSCLLISGCTDEIFPEVFYGTEDFILENNGRATITFKELDCQTGCNELRNEFWITDDNARKYYRILCQDAPSAGTSVKAQLIYNTSGSDSDEVRRNVDLEVLKEEEETGKIWLWDSMKKIGAVVRDIR